MTLTRTQRKNLKEDGWTRRDIDDLDARLDEGGDDRKRDDDDDRGDDDRRSRRKSNGHDDAGRVSVFEGAAAERVLERLGLNADDDEDDDDDDRDDDDRKSRSRSRSRSRDEGRRGSRYFDR